MTGQIASTQDSVMRLLLTVFKTSPAVERGGPGGFPVSVNGEIWNIGLSPGEVFFASNGVSGQEVEHYCGYHFVPGSLLIKNEVASYIGGGYTVDLTAEQTVTSVDEVCWLIELVMAASMAEWGASVKVRSRPTRIPVPEIPRMLLSCGCWVGLIVQQRSPCGHNSGRYPHHELDLEYVPCGCDEDWGCDRCKGHRGVYARRFMA